MVVTPQQAGEKYLIRNEGLLKRLEKQIDKALVEDFRPGYRNDVCITPPEELEPGSPVFLKIRDMYEQAGWKVEYESDQREGDFLRFTQRGGRL